MGKPNKKNEKITLHLDVDIIQWFKSQEGKYQSNINQALREYMKANTSHG